VIDISLRFDPDIMEFDLVLDGNAPRRDLQGDNGLLTAVIVSLFTDCRAHDDDPLPDERVGQASDMRGWWGDYFEQEKTPDPVGSRLWLLWREKEMETVVARAQQYAREALAWLARERLTERIEVTASHAGPRYLGINVRALPPPGVDDVTREWNFVFDYANARPVKISAPGV
jgi:phage gp46-like protein